MFFPLNPEEILMRLNLKPHMLAADFGCGPGFFTIPLAERLNKGLVYAIDIQKEPLSVLKSTALFKELDNIQIIHSDLEKPNGSKIDDNFLDLVLLINILFKTENKFAIIKEAKRVLNKEGKLLVIDPEPFKKDFEEMGFKTRKMFKPGDCHGIVFEKA
jgi:ubiquinone/menaquinone biosynthesis C-methylase UbiE